MTTAYSRHITIILSTPSLIMTTTTTNTSVSMMCYMLFQHAIIPLNDTSFDGVKRSAENVIFHFTELCLMHVSLGLDAFSECKWCCIWAAHSLLHVRISSFFHLNSSLNTIISLTFFFFVSASNEHQHRYSTITQLVANKNRTTSRTDHYKTIDSGNWNLYKPQQHKCFVNKTTNEARTPVDYQSDP